jgi:quercetin dioxygenase-like cupin family protein
MAAGYTIKHRDEFEAMEGSGDCTWMLARKALGTSAFGFNLVEIEPGGQIPEHTEAESGQVELYVILEGDAVLRIEGEDHPAPAGTFASLEPPASRTILNRSEAKVTAMLIGVQPEGGYLPMSWA